MCTYTSQHHGALTFYRNLAAACCCGSCGAAGWQEDVRLVGVSVCETTYEYTELVQQQPVVLPEGDAWAPAAPVAADVAAMEIDTAAGAPGGAPPAGPGEELPQQQQQQQAPAAGGVKVRTWTRPSLRITLQRLLPEPGRHRGGSPAMFWDGCNGGSSSVGKVHQMCPCWDLQQPRPPCKYAVRSCLSRSGMERHSMCCPRCCSMQVAVGVVCPRSCSSRWTTRSGPWSTRSTWWTGGHSGSHYNMCLLVRLLAVSRVSPGDCSGVLTCCWHAQCTPHVRCKP
jgi:hypothetical protein